MARMEAGLVYVGIKGRVVALDRRTGERVWLTELKGSGFVFVQRDGDMLFATANGEIFALKPKTGELLWHNPLKGLGMGFSSIAGDYPTSPGSAAAVSLEAQRQAAAVAAAG